MWIQFVLASLLIYLFTGLNPRKKEKKKNLPPGIYSFWQLFLFGITRIGIPNYILSATASKRFGSIFGVKFPTQYAVGVTDLEFAKKIMNSSDWINRLPDDHILYEGTGKKPLGLLFSNDEHWRQSRRFTVKILHSFGFHRQHTMENLISFEINELHQKLDKHLKESGGDLNPHLLFELPTLNIIWSLIAGIRFPDGDPNAEMLLKYCNYFNRQFNLGATAVDVFPFLRRIPGLTCHDSWIKSHKVFNQFFHGIIVERRAKGLYKEQPLDFIDHFLQEIDSHVGEEPNYFTDESFIAVCTDILLGGADTTNSSLEMKLEFAVLHMALNQDIQYKVQAEIDEHIGQDRHPCYDDKRNLIYTQAVINEVLRQASSVPIASRSPLHDSYLNGYLIPKGTLVGINIHAIHHSDQLWKDPFVFRPERFLVQEDSQSKIVNTDKIIPFGFGKRMCLGESVARMTLFNFFTFLLQKYSFGLSKNHPRPTLGNVHGLSRCPPQYYVSVTSREASS